jgi:GH15 family glucan-1,4-alpha-glucosidase
VGLDGAVDWLCLPRFDSPPALAALLDAQRGGAFTLAPAEPFEAGRRYLPGTNVLETTFTSAGGTIRVTDGLLLGAREPTLVRRVEGLAGAVPLRWSSPLEVVAWGAGEGESTLAQGGRALLVAGGEPQRRDDAERALDDTAAEWARWSGRAGYDGSWRDLVVRSALALRLLVHAPTGAMVAAPTTSLPEELGGSRNWDYRYSWLRDSLWSVRALLRLGYTSEASEFCRWLTSASHGGPPLSVVHPVGPDGDLTERELDLPGYRGSAPVRAGNGAFEQHQLDVYGTVIDAMWTFEREIGGLDAEAGAELAALADFTAACWRQEDSGIWEARCEPRHFVQSKVMAWVALYAACQLVELGVVPDRRARWEPELDAIRAWVENAGWDAERGRYRRAAGLPDLDASLLTTAFCGYTDADDPRFAATVDAIRSELAAGGPLLYRYRGDDGLEGSEGAFVTCSFWLVEALARGGRVDEAAELMEALLEQANDVGLYAEEIDPSTGEFLGNFPQALVHLALINAAVALAG